MLFCFLCLSTLWLHNAQPYQARNITCLCALLAFYIRRGMFIISVVATRQLSVHIKTAGSVIHCLGMWTWMEDTGSEKEKSCTVELTSWEGELCIWALLYCLLHFSKRCSCLFSAEGHKAEGHKIEIYKYVEKKQMKYLSIFISFNLGFCQYNLFPFFIF